MDVSGIHANIYDNLSQYIPAVYLELLLGLTLGINELNKISIFKEALVRTGTIHVVVISGYNISLIHDIVSKIVGGIYNRKGLILSMCATLSLALLSGFNPPVVRAWVMGSIVSLGKYYGRSISAFSVLLFSCLIMLLADRELLVSASFHLSFLATLGLIVMNFHNKCRLVFMEDFLSSLSAQIFVLPYLSHYFSNMSILSIMINSLTLWLVTPTTILGYLFLVAFLISPTFALLIFKIFIFPFLDVFISIINWFSKFSFVSVDYKMPLEFFTLYYAILLLYLLFLRENDSR